MVLHHGLGREAHRYEQGIARARLKERRSHEFDTNGIRLQAFILTTYALNTNKHKLINDINAFTSQTLSQDRYMSIFPYLTAFQGLISHESHLDQCSFLFLSFVTKTLSPIGTLVRAQHDGINDCMIFHIDLTGELFVRVSVQIH